LKQEDYQSRIDSVLEKIGNEASNLILDDVAILLNDNKIVNEEIEKKNQEIENLKKMNSTLQTVNGNLLQQVAVGVDETTIEKKNKEETENKSKSFSMRSVFDEKGNFKI